NLFAAARANRAPNDRFSRIRVGANIDLIRAKIRMCRHKNTIPHATPIALVSMLVFGQHAGAEQAEPRYTPLGHEARAFGTGAAAIGWGAEARGDNSIAIGARGDRMGVAGTSASNGGIAIGVGSQSHS